MDALVVSGPGVLTISQRPLAEPSPDQAVVRVLFGGICGSDLHYWRSGRVGESVLLRPMVLGHEVVGVVERPAADGSGPAVGTRVAVHPAQICGACVFCARGDQQLCENLRYLGSAARDPHTDGGFSEHLVIPAHRLVPVPDGLDLQVAALAEPASVVLHGLRRLEHLGHSVEGRDVLITGAGPIGLLAVALAHAGNARTITATDLHDNPLKLALQIGATHTAQANEPLPPADLVIESSGSPAAVALALRALRPGGAMVNVGHLPADGVLAPLHLAVTRELTIAGSSRFYSELPDALAIIAAHPHLFAPIISATYPLASAEAAFAEAADPSRSSKVLLTFAD
ncbi:alcohol dehydrogenase catalytic domain-containing protein [Kribbella sp. NPDC056861]|uniref:alcohol dehydrogenase catalytic domain-containing protein n=1 Tax=Kribbella sp. NPDC056861 TaxID=3154857 RepID=UPI00343729B7